MISKVENIFKTTPLQKCSAKGTKKTALASSKKTSSSKKTRGWLGGEGGPQTNLSKWYGPQRALFLPSGLLDRSEVPTYLTGELAGDYGYDPLGLGKDTEQVSKYREFELIHARWAMLASAGFIIPEGLESNGAKIIGGTWFETGRFMLDGGTLNYFAVPWGIASNPLPLFVVLVIEVALMAAVESYRKNGTLSVFPAVESYRKNGKGLAGYSPG